MLPIEFTRNEARGGAAWIADDAKLQQSRSNEKLSAGIPDIKHRLS